MSHARTGRGHGIDDGRSPAMGPAPGKRARTDRLAQRTAPRQPAADGSVRGGAHAAMVDPFDVAALTAPDARFPGPGDDRAPGGQRVEDDGDHESTTVQRQTDAAATAGGGDDAMCRHVVGERSTAVGKLARVRAPRGVRLRTQPASGAADVGIAPFDELVQVERRTDHGWCWVVALDAMSGSTGFCEEQFLALDPPDPTAHLHRVEPGERLADIAVRHYGADLRDENQVRLYVQALYLANKDHAGVYLDEVDLSLRDTVGRGEAEVETVKTYKGAKVRAGLAIWVPSDAFIMQMKVAGMVSDGSTAFTRARQAITGMAERIVDVAVYNAGFVVGLMHGAWNAIADLFVGAADMMEAVAKVTYHVVTGNPGAVKAMLMGWVGKLALAWANRDKLADDFMSKWESEDGWTRGTFQGEVLGWVMMPASDSSARRRCLTDSQYTVAATCTSAETSTVTTAACGRRPPAARRTCEARARATGPSMKI